MTVRKWSTTGPGSKTCVCTVRTLNLTLVLAECVVSTVEFWTFFLSDHLIGLICYIMYAMCVARALTYLFILFKKKTFVATFCLENIYQKQFGGILHQNDIS